PLPSSDESIQAQHAFTAQFPHAQSAPSSEVVLLEGPDIVGPVGKNATLAIAQALTQDPRLHNVSSVVSLYGAYAGYLTGQAELAWGFLGPALSASPSLPAEVNATATTVWGPATTYVAHWNAIRSNQTPGTPAASADWPAYNLTRAAFPAGSAEAEVLQAFYEGNGSAEPGFNATILGGCLASSNVTACADQAMEDAVPNALPGIFPAPGSLPTAQAALAQLSLATWTIPGAQQAVAATVLGAEVGLAPGWLLTVWQAFPNGTPPTPAALAGWAAQQVQQDPLDALPLPVPGALLGSFVNPARTATLIVISFNVDDTYTANGTTVTFADVDEIHAVVDQALAASTAYRSITAYETGGAPLDSATTYLATSALGLLLVLTIVVLLVIMLLYFRAPSAPLLAFGMIAIALVVNLAVIYVVGTFVTTFNSEIESIVLVFLMSIGTDYSVFLLARYREELVKGTEPTEAVATTVRWAGQSITTSGIAVMVVAVALGLSGISFLSELGIALLISVFFALLVNLTVLPSILVLVGPKVFWPNSGERFRRYARRRVERVATHRDGIARAGRAATTRPLAVIGIVMLLSVPVVIVALEVPVSYDVTNIGLPASNSAQVGYQHLTQGFGASYSSPSYVLVTFPGPVVAGSGPDPATLRDVAGLGATMNATPGVASVSSFVGPGGAPLAAWLNYSVLPPAEQLALNSSLSAYVGSDGRTVLFNIQTNASGFSATAITVLNALQQRVQAYEAAHPGVTRTYYGGAAPTTQDIRSLVTQAEEEMLVG
ncbi:MAG TPA: MMPL family transporter, partial [Thermoplasmata archaeon]|nr:MMPL family transporter [Thermoplasmata archaeon]